MVFSIRKYKKDDFDSVLKLLQNSLNLDNFTHEILEEKIYQDPFFDENLIWVSESDEKIIGFLQGVCRQIKDKNYGYVKLMAVEKKYRRQGIARKMYSLLEQSLKQKETDIIRLGDVPMNYFMPGIDPRYTPAICFAIRMGFYRFTDTSNLLVDLAANDWSNIEKIEKLKSDNIKVSRATEEDKKELMEFVEPEWDLWKYELEMAYENNPISIHIARLNGKIKAFSAYSANNKGMAWFGPMGTHPDLRGKGIGKVLLFDCLKDLKNIGYKNAIIPWVGPIDFYSHHANAVVDRVFWRYEKTLP